MPTVPKLPNPTPIDFLVERKFAITTARHKLQQIMQKDDPEEAIAKLQEDEQKAEQYRQTLEKKPKHEIDALYKEEKALQEQENERRKLIMEQQRFFNQPSANADLAFWSKHAYWSLDEAIALTFGKNPAIVNWQSVQPHATGRYDVTGYIHPSPFAQEYEKLVQLVLRAKTWNQLYDPSIPGMFLAWAKLHKIPYPPELEEMVVAHGGVVRDWKTAYDELNEMKEKQAAQHEEYQASVARLLKAHEETHKANDSTIASCKAFEKILKDRIATLEQQGTTSEKPLSTRERDTVLKLVIGIAMDAYGYQPEASRSPTAKEISDNLISLGLNISDDTIRKYLNEAKQFLPPKTE